MARRSFIDELRAEKPELLNDFLKYIQLHTYEETAREFAPRFKMDESKLLARLPVWNAQYRIRRYEEPHIPRPDVSKKNEAEEPKEKESESRLTEEEIKFLQDFKEGKVTYEQAQRELAYRVLRKVLENPELLKVADWLRSEVIKIQREELSMKKEYMERSWGMLFAGWLPPKLCPKCGHDLQPNVAVPLENKELKILEGETIDETQPVGTTTSVS